MGDLLKNIEALHTLVGVLVAVFGCVLGWMVIIWNREKGLHKTLITNLKQQSEGQITNLKQQSEGQITQLRERITNLKQQSEGQITNLKGSSHKCMHGLGAVGEGR